MHTNEEQTRSPSVNRLSPCGRQTGSISVTTHWFPSHGRRIKCGNPSIFRH